ncbi:ATP-binding protein [Labedaea rhizosphaerae]|nr:ATP-binding protein [Labedaea rhizosphaerae]
MREEIEIRLPAEPDQLSLLRTVAGAIAMRADFDLDAIADLKIAVDEACSMLIMQAAKGAVLRCTFGTDEDGIVVQSEVATDGNEPLDDTAFGWHVLSTLTDESSWTRSEAGVCLRLSLQRKVNNS